MKKLLFFSVIFFTTLKISGQTPSALSYQAVVRNASNTLVSNASVGVKITISQGSANGTTAYSEKHTVTTNENGLFTLEIGNGSILSGNMENIDWSTGPYFLTSDIDPVGGTNYTLSNSSQLMSVPYALYAKKSGSSSSSENMFFLPGNISAVQTKILTNLSSSNYTVPSGKVFLTFAGIMNAGSSTYIGGTVYGNAGSTAIIIPNATYNIEVLLNNSGTTITSNNNSNKFLGYLIDNTVFKSSGNYNIPAGKTLIILYAKDLNLDGISLDSKINVFNGTSPLIVNSGTVITNSFIGYLR